ncbi:hypothetical protein [Delftia acidovorans]|nr:hypothetical protein [Delftia acidovorans]
MPLTEYILEGIDGRWYEVHVPIADRLYDTHLETLQKEGRIDGQEIQ